ncbi:MAG: VanZ family protein [Steroidobacteraceae bacterium]|jgi:VanZ family protein
MTAFRQLRLARLWFLIGSVLIAVTLYFALKPGGPPAGFPYADKVYHASAFFLLSAWFAGLFERRAYLWLAAAMLVLGIGIEIAQYLMPYGRTAEVGDVLADAVGMVLGLLLAVLLRDSLFARIEKWLTPN